MMKRRTIAASAAIILAGTMNSIARAQLTEFVWTGAVGNAWRQDGNWDIAGFPNAGNNAASVSASSNLTIELGGSNTTVAALTFDGISSTAAIDISSTGGLLILQNDGNNQWVDPDGGIEGGEIAPVLTSVGPNEGRVLITSAGVAGATNMISAPIRINNSGFLEGVDIVGNRSITLAGALEIVGDEVETPFGTFAALRSFLPEGERVLISGDISLNDPVAAGNPARSLVLNSYGTTDHGIVDGGAFPNDLRSPPRGTIEIAGNISGAGGLTLGWGWSPNQEQFGPPAHDPAPPPALPLSTVILSGANDFSGDVVISRGNVALRSDTALGNGGTVRQIGQPGSSREVGYNLVVDEGDRTIANPLAIVQWLTIKGNSSLTWEGMIYQDGTRGLINLLPYDHTAGAGDTLTLAGPVYANRESEMPPVPGRIFTLDGTGRTVLTGGLHDNFDDDPVQTLAFTGQFRKRGTGTVVIDYDETNPNDTPTDYGGYTWMESGNLHFATDADLPSPTFIEDANAEILSTGGAIGVDEGVIGNSAFLGMLNNSSNPNWSDGPIPGTGPPFFRSIFAGLRTIVERYDHGGLMLGSNEYDENLDFNSGDLANAAMSVAAWETGSTYTGTITPSTSALVNPNTYQLGGGAGALTLPNDNQLTGARNLLATNGGEVRLVGTNDYTGTTHVLGKFHTSLQEDAAADTADRDHDGDYSDNLQQIYVGTTLSVTNLADGSSSLGNSSSDASNLMIQGSTLKYVGGAVNTDRLFTVGTAGATIDASGTGALVFSNTGALGIDIAEDRPGVIAGGVPGNDNNEVFGIPTFTSPSLGRVTFRTDDLVPGMAIRDINPSGAPALDDDLIITSVAAAHVVRVGEEEVEEGETPWPGLPANTFIRTFTFGPAPERQFTLSGSNLGTNTLAPVIGDASDGGVVGITKTGPGKWVLSGNNTYTGSTKVQAGILLINGNQSGDGVTTVAAGAALGGTGTLGGSLVLSEGSSFTAAFSAGTIDPLAILGDVDLSALADTLSVTGSGSGESWVLATYSGMLTGAFETIAGGFTVDYGSGTNSQITLTAGGGVLAGDYNQNGVVDAADYTVWRDNLGTSGPLPNDQLSGPIGQAHYQQWKNNFGATLGSASSGGAAAVPEPASVGLAIMGCAMIVIVARRHRRAMPGQRRAGEIV
jgi:autotransporter-associated beta strand protein